MKRYIVDPLEPIECMSLVSVDTQNNINVQVNPDHNRLEDPYFKVYNNARFESSDKVARISFLEPIYIVHAERYNCGRNNWFLNSKEKKRLIDFLIQEHSHHDTVMTTYQFSILMFNSERFSMSFEESIKTYR